MIDSLDRYLDEHNVPADPLIAALACLTEASHRIIDENAFPYVTVPRAALRIALRGHFATHETLNDIVEWAAVRAEWAAARAAATPRPRRRSG